MMYCECVPTTYARVKIMKFTTLRTRYIIMYTLHTVDIRTRKIQLYDQICVSTHGFYLVFHFTLLLSMTTLSECRSAGHILYEYTYVVNLCVMIVLLLFCFFFFLRARSKIFLKNLHTRTHTRVPTRPIFRVPFRRRSHYFGITCVYCGATLTDWRGDQHWTGCAVGAPG